MRIRAIRAAWLVLVVSGAMTLTANAGGVTVQQLEHGISVKAAHYEAYIAPDGCLTSLKVGGRELLQASVGVSRGAYLSQDGQPVALPRLEVRGGRTVTARGPAGWVRYEFGPEQLRWTVCNRTRQLMHHFMVLDPAVDSASDGAEAVLPTPFRRDWPSTTWYREDVRLRVDGTDVVWGPWEHGTQVSEVALKPGERRVLQLVAGPVSGSELQSLVRAGVRGDRKRRAVRGRNYRATVGDDGALCSLRVRGREFLSADVSVSRGAYLSQGGPLALPRVEQPSADLITAAGDRACVRLEGTPDGLVWTASNLSVEPMMAFMVIDPAFDVVGNEDGQVVRSPAERSWPDTTWFCRGVKVRVRGGQWIFGPWHGRQVWQARLEAGEQRSISFSFGTANEVERERVEWVPTMASLEAEGRPKPGELTVLEPRHLQVYQRRSRTDGAIVVRGNVQRNADQVLVRIRGESLEGPLPDVWQPIPVFGTTHAFDAELPVPAGGWYDVDLRAIGGERLVAKTCVERVGVGEVFVGAGQSNSTNSGEQRIAQETGLVATFSGGHWESGSDPQPGVHDGTRGGSFWPAFGDAMARRYHVPIGIAATGHSGTSVFQWQRQSDLYRWLMVRLNQLGLSGFRALLWHQGEADAGYGANAYYKGLKALIEWSRYDAGWRFPWFVAHASYHSPREPLHLDVRAGQSMVWASGLALPGPDTDGLAAPFRDLDGQGIHLNPDGLRRHGQMWADKAAAFVDDALGK